VAQGFVKGFAHPEGNITGFVGWGELYSKEMELFKEIVPRLHRLLVLIDPQDPQTERALAEVRQAGAALKLQLLEREVINQANAERVFRSLKQGGVDGVFIASPNLRTKFPALIVSLSSERHLPLAMHRMQWVEKGALFSYGFDARELGRGAVTYVDKILRGTKPADLPVQQPPRLELVISLKTAKQIGVTIPPNVLARADRLIR
jgi:putative tryptophan/tyrosine transport system substrate-binding protein